MSRWRVVATGLTAVAVVVTGCGKSSSNKAQGTKGTVTVGSANFTENVILANMYAEVLKNRGYTAKTRLNLGSREIVAPAIQRGEIDVYPGYAWTDLQFYDKNAQPSSDPNGVVATLRDQLKPLGLTALDPSPAVDQNAFAVTQATADKYHLAKLSDLAPVAPQLNLGAGSECATRPLCQPGLERVYGIKFKSLKPFPEPGGALELTALERGDVDVGLVFSSASQIVTKKLVVLEDDKHLQNADNVVPIIRQQLATGDVATTLNAVSAKLTTQDLIDLNRNADEFKADPDTLAIKWLRDHGFLPMKKKS